MPVHDARTGAEAATEAGLGASTASSPTTAPAAPAASPTTVPAAPAASPAGGHEVPAESDCETTLSMRPVREFTAPAPEGADAAPAPPGPADDLLGRIGDWDPLLTPVGTFRLLPVRPERDTALLARWMNDPAVAAFWELDGPEEVTGRHLRAQLEGEGHSVPCLGVLDGTVMSYWELYRADLAPSPGTIRPGRTTPASTCSSVPSPTADAGSARRSCGRSPTSSSTTARPAPAWSPNRTCATPPPSPPS